MNIDPPGTMMIPQYSVTTVTLASRNQLMIKLMIQYTVRVSNKNLYSIIGEIFIWCVMWGISTWSLLGSVKLTNINICLLISFSKTLNKYWWLFNNLAVVLQISNVTKIQRWSHSCRNSTLYVHAFPFSR